MTNDELKAAIAVCEQQIEQMTRETIRRNYGLKMRNYADTIFAMVQLKEYYENKMNKPAPKVITKKEVGNE